MNNRLTLSQIVIYGLPGLPLAMLGLPLFVYLPSYYSQNLGLSLSAVGLALLLARSLDVLTDPLIGLLNDRRPKFKTLRWRRKSFMFMGIPLLIIGLNFLLKPGEDVSVFYLFIWSFITYLGWTLINIPWHALGAEISPNYHEKSALASSREIFSVFGTVAVISLPIVLSIQSQLDLTLETTANILIILIPISLIPLLLSLSSQNLDESKILPSRNKLFNKKSFAALKHPAIVKLLPAYFLNSIANALPATLFILYVSYVLQTPEKIGLLLSFYFLSAIVGIPLWLTIAKRTDKHRSWCIALLGAILSFIWVPFIGEGDITAFIFICIASGFCLGADVVMPASIQADISQHIATKNLLKQEVENKENEDSTALLFGVWGLLTKLSLAIAIGVAFPLLGALGLNASNTDTQVVNDSASYALIILYALIPIIFKIWVLIRMWYFPFDKDFFTANVTTHKTNTQKGKRNEINKPSTTGGSVSAATSYKRMQ